MRLTRHRPRRPSAVRCLIGYGTSLAGRRALRRAMRQLVSARRTALVLEHHGPCWPSHFTLEQVLEDTCLEHARFCCAECFANPPALEADEEDCPRPLAWCRSR